MKDVVFHRVTLRQEALDRYMAGESLVSIARDLSVPYGTVHHWHTREQWAGMRRQMRADLLDDWKARFRILAANELYCTVVRHITLAQQFSERIAEAVARDDLTPKDLALLASALAAEFNVIAPLLEPILQPPTVSQSDADRPPLVPRVAQ